MFLRMLIVFLAVSLSSGTVQSHELWIDPVDHLVGSGEPVVADLRVGQEFEGPAYSYFPRSFRQFEIAFGNESAPVDGRSGDRPAVNQTVPPGLSVIVHVTTDSRLGYSEWEKFRAFVEHKDAEWTLSAHDARGLPREGFGEVYSRYAKSLVSVGDGAGADRAFGLETEIVAGLNPYTDDLSDGLPVTVFYQGAPRADAQLEVFAKAPDGTVVITQERTDAQGRAIVPVKPGHRYMLDAVVLREPAPDVAEANNAVWESLWANLTFAVPAR